MTDKKDKKNNHLTQEKLKKSAQKLEYSYYQETRLIPKAVVSKHNQNLILKPTQLRTLNADNDAELIVLTIHRSFHVSVSFPLVVLSSSPFS